MRRLAIVSLGLAIMAFCATASSNAGPGAAAHQHLSSVVRRCEILGNLSAFYLCQPDFDITPDPSSSNPLRWRLTGDATSSTGSKTFSDKHGSAQVLLQNDQPFGTTGQQAGVTLRGRVAKGTILLFGFAPSPTTLRGYAVWKLAQPARNLRLSTTKHGSGAELFADGKSLRPTLLIAPARQVHDAALTALFQADMRHLEAVADGQLAGACVFFAKTRAGATDAACAQALGVTGKHSEIEASLSTATVLSYNGYTLAQHRLEGQLTEWVFARGHFRLLQTNIVE